MAKKKNGKTGNKKIKKKSGGRVVRRQEDTVRDHLNIKDEKLRKHLRFMDIVWDKSYDRNGKKIDEDGNEVDLFGVVNKFSTLKGYRSSMKKFVEWSYGRYGNEALDFRYYKKEWSREYFKEHFDKIEENSDDANAIGTVGAWISGLNKFEEALEKQWKERTGKNRDFGIIPTIEIREYMNENGLNRDIEKMKKSYKLTDEKLARKVELELRKEYGKEYGDFWRHLCETGTRVDAGLNNKTSDIILNQQGKNNGVYFNNGKAGNKYTNEYVDINYLNELKDRFQDGKDKLLFSFKDKNNNEKRIETKMRQIEKAIKSVGKKFGIDNLGPHSGRSFYNHKAYYTLLKKSEGEIDKIINSNPQLYQQGLSRLIKDKKEKRLYNDRSYRHSRTNRKRIPPEWLNWKKEFKRSGKLPKHLNYPIRITKEEKVAMLTSIFTGHRGRLSILSYYVQRTTARKVYGSKSNKKGA